MKITFSHLGFRSSSVFITDVSDKDTGQYHIGYVTDRYLNDIFDFDYFGVYLDKFKDRIPTSEQIIEEYKRQFAAKGVCVNPDGIVYAG